MQQSSELNPNIDLAENNELLDTSSLKDANEEKNNVILTKIDLHKKSVRFSDKTLKKVMIMMSIWNMDFNEVVSRSIDEIFKNELYPELERLKSS